MPIQYIGVVRHRKLYLVQDLRSETVQKVLRTMDPCYILHKNVLYRLDNNKIYYVFYRDGSDSVDFGFKLPKIPLHKMLQSYLYMKAIYEAKGTEARLDLLYSFKRKRYRWIPPEQINSAAGVSYKRTEETRQAIKNGWQIIGSAHSHPNMVGLSHSGTDEEDEHENPGIHFTFGFNNSYGSSIFPTLKVHCRLVLTDMFISLDLKDLVDISYGFGFPQNWMNRVQTYRYSSYKDNQNVTVIPYRPPGARSLYPQENWGKDTKEEIGFCPENDDEEDFDDEERIEDIDDEERDEELEDDEVIEEPDDEEIGDVEGITEEVHLNPEDLDKLTEVNPEELVANLEDIESDPDSIQDPDMPESSNLGGFTETIIEDKKK